MNADLTGQHFGQLTVVLRMRDGRWLCECNCPSRNMIALYSSDLKRRTSCGCIRPGHLDTQKRFERFIEEDQTLGCWNWTGGLYTRGYAHFAIGSRVKGTWRNVLGHRFAYELYRGNIPAGLELDHLCRNRRCVAVSRNGA